MGGVWGTLAELLKQLPRLVSMIQKYLKEVRFEKIKREVAADLNEATLTKDTSRLEKRIRGEDP